MFKTTREARLNLNVNYLCYALRALFWTLIIINWTLIISLIFFVNYSLMFILVRQINCSLSHIYPYVFKTFDLSFMFHFYVSTYWLSIISKSETYDFNVSFLVSCFIFQNTEGARYRSLSVFESLPQCFEIAPSVFLFFSLSVFKMKHWN